MLTRCENQAWTSNQIQDKNVSSQERVDEGSHNVSFNHNMSICPHLYKWCHITIETVLITIDNYNIKYNIV